MSRAYTDEEIAAGLPDVKVEPKRQRQARRDVAVLPAAVEAASRYLAEAEPAVEGAGGQAHTGVVCIRTLAFVPDPEQALALMRPWNARCLPPWDEDELLDRLQRATVEADVAPGSRAEMAQAKADALAEAKDISEIDRNELRAAWRFSTLAEAETLPEPAWHFPGILPASGLGVVYGEPEKGKTWLVLDMAFRLSSGLGGLGREPGRPVDVVLYAGEGIRGVATKRANAWFAHHALDRSKARLLLTPNPPDVSSQDSMEAFARGVTERGFRPGLVVFDTYARALAEAGLSENDPGDVMQYVKAAEALKQHFDAMVLAIHHSGKDSARGARGSNSLRGAIDVEWEVDADWSARRIVATCTKMKDWERPKEPLAFEVVDVEGTGGLVLEPLDGKEAAEAVSAVGEQPRGRGRPRKVVRLDNGAVGEVLRSDPERIWLEGELAADLLETDTRYGSVRSVRMMLGALRQTTGGTAFYLGKHVNAHHWKWKEADVTD